jgi:hypothetical protein
MPVLDILATLDDILEDPAWLMFGLAVGVGLLGFLLLMLYPMGRD